MSTFWGYEYADMLAMIIVSGTSLGCLICARLFIARYHA